MKLTTNEVWLRIFASFSKSNWKLFAFQHRRVRHGHRPKENYYKITTILKTAHMKTQTISTISPLLNDLKMNANIPTFSRSLCMRTTFGWAFSMNDTAKFIWNWRQKNLLKSSLWKLEFKLHARSAAHQRNCCCFTINYIYVYTFTLSVISIYLTNEKENALINAFYLKYQTLKSFVLCIRKTIHLI